MEIDDAIKSKLNLLGVDSSLLKPYLINYLRTIEEEIQSRHNNRNLARQTLGENDYDVKTIAENTGISRTTFYNYNRILQRYVELSHESDYRDDPYFKIKELKEEIHILQEEKRLMEKRDCRELQLLDENAALKRQLAERDKVISNLKKLF